MAYTKLFAEESTFNERVAGGFVPFLRERAAARPAGERGGCVGDGFLRVAHQHRRSCVGEIGIRFQVAQANLRVLCGAEEIHAVSPPFPYAKGQALAARRQAAVLREVHHLDEILRRAIRALPDFHRHEQIGGKLIGRRSRIGDCDLQRCIDLRDRRDDQEHVVLDESAGAGIAERALRFAVRGVRVRQQHRVGEQVPLRIIQQRAHQRSDLPRGVIRR
jgi:hypothetical protein